MKQNACSRCFVTQLVFSFYRLANADFSCRHVSVRLSVYHKLGVVLKWLNAG